MTLQYSKLKWNHSPKAPRFSWEVRAQETEKNKLSHHCVISIVYTLMDDGSWPTGACHCSFMYCHHNSDFKSPTSNNRHLRTFHWVFRYGQRCWFRRQRFRHDLCIHRLIFHVHIKLKSKRQLTKCLSQVFHGVAPHVCRSAVFGTLCVQERARTKIYSDSYILRKTVGEERGELTAFTKWNRINDFKILLSKRDMIVQVSIVLKRLADVVQ